MYCHLVESSTVYDEYKGYTIRVDRMKKVDPKKNKEFGRSFNRYIVLANDMYYLASFRYVKDAYAWIDNMPSIVGRKFGYEKTETKA